MPLIALLSDFGERDGFVGVMKGVLSGLLRRPVPLIDISHGIDAQNIRHGAWVLEHTFPFFPPKTIFICVVDPMVGTDAQASLLCWWPDRQQAFIGPDNGLLSPIFEKGGERLQVYDIRQSLAWQKTTAERSRTFHGRDVYAPIAASMANAILENSVPGFLAGFGPAWTDPVRLEHRQPERRHEGEREILSGQIVYTDIFGNLITNLPNDWVRPGQGWSVTIENNPAFKAGCFQAYAEAAGTPDEKSVLIIPSSGGTVELSIYQGNAEAHLKAKSGQRVTLQSTEIG